MSSETKAAFENMKFYKFYPVTTSDSPDVSSVKVNLSKQIYEAWMSCGFIYWVELTNSNC